MGSQLSPDTDSGNDFRFALVGTVKLTLQTGRGQLFDKLVNVCQLIGGKFINQLA